jgi:DNA-binding MarR family transcriptional regulator
MSQPTEPESIDRLLGQICKLHYFRAFELLEKIGLYRGQPPMLRALSEEEGLTHSELAAHLHVTPATITKMIKRMEKAGFVERRPDLEDQRISRVYLTQAGRAIQADMQQTLQTLEKETFAGFTLQEHVLLRRFFLQIRDNLVRATGGEPPF